MTLDDRETIGEEVVDIPTPFPDERENKPSPQPGKYIVYSRNGRVSGILIAEQYEDTVVFTNYKTTRRKGIMSKSGTMYQGKKNVKLSSLKPDHRIIFKLGTRENVELVKIWNPDGFLKDYLIRDSFFR